MWIINLHDDDQSRELSKTEVKKLKEAFRKGFIELVDESGAALTWKELINVDGDMDLDGDEFDEVEDYLADE
jgi:hypothetical protein